MDAVVSYPHSLLRFPSSSSSSSFCTSKFRTTPIFPVKEITDGPSVFATQRNLGQLRISTVRAANNRSGRSLENEGNKIPESSDGKESKSSNQEEMIALFRRIHSQISKGESTISKKKSSRAAAESLLDVLQSRKRVMEKTSNEEGDKVLTHRHGPSKNDEKIDYCPPSVDPKLTRPPSNFVKRSPIQSLASTNGKFEQGNEDASTSTVGVVKVSEMKVSELKELAKVRGIKGYSKLKKSELLELLSRS